MDGTQIGGCQVAGRRGNKEGLRNGFRVSF